MPTSLTRLPALPLAPTSAGAVALALTLALTCAASPASAA